jgi:hypothetical protein
VGEKDGEPVLHQSVMTTLLAGAVDQVQAEFQSWNFDLIRHHLFEQARMELGSCHHG